MSGTFNVVDALYGANAGLSLGSIIAGHQSAKVQAEMEEIDRKNRNARINRDHVRDVARASAQVSDVAKSTKAQSIQQQIALRKAQGSVLAQAAQAGNKGTTLDTILGDLATAKGANMATIKANQRMALRRVYAGLERAGDSALAAYNPRAKTGPSASIATLEGLASLTNSAVNYKLRDI